MLKRCVVGFAQWSAQCKGHPKRAGGLHALGIFPHKANARGQDAGGFQIIAERAHGAGAVGSNRGYEYCVDQVLFQQACDLGGAARIDFGHEARAHKTVMKLG